MTKAMKDAAAILFRTLALAVLLTGVYVVTHPAPHTKPWEMVCMTLILAFSAALKWEIAEDIRRA